MENPYYPQSATIEKIIDETPTINTYVLSPEKPVVFRAGQFIQLTVPGLGEAPFTPSSSPYEPETVEVTILKTGTVTDALKKLKPGDKVGIRGPFGKGYPVDKFAGKEVLVVGGGVGLAPLRSLLLSLFHDIQKYKRVVIKYGAKSPKEHCYRNAYDEWRKVKNVDFEVTIDQPYDGWKGKVGLVTTLLDGMDVDLSNSYVVSCGPEIMLKFVTFKLIDVGFKPDQIYLSMNRRMSCGIGKCGRCNIGPYYLCKDGPDVNYATVKDYPNVFG